MGRGSYTANDWLKLKNSRKLANHREVKDIFGSGGANSAYCVNNINLRESRDSSDSPNSTPIIIGFDVTASMGYLAKELAVNGVNSAVNALLRDKPISDPQIMCCAIGDCKSDKSPLQVTQFESDIRIVEQLLGLYLEGGGGGNDGESYNLLWYFASRHTEHDCYELRKKKGYLFTIGDDKCHSGLSTVEINRVFSDNSLYALSNEELLAEVRKKYHIVHIHIRKSGIDNDEIFSQWVNSMPGYATYINIQDIGFIAELIVAIISVLSGIPANTVLKSGDQFVSEKIAPSLGFIKPASEEKKTIVF